MANLNLSEFTEKLFVTDADHTFIWDTVGAISKRVSRNSWLNSGTLTSDAPVTISQTWATTGTYTAFKVVANETATAASASNLLELWSGNAATLKVKVNKLGQLIVPPGTSSAPSLCFTTDKNGFYKLNNGFGYATDTNNPVLTANYNSALGMLSGMFLGWSTDVFTQPDWDVRLYKDAANTLALRNGEAPQTFRLYNTYSAGGTNFERLNIQWSGGAARIFPDAGGTGTLKTVYLGSDSVANNAFLVNGASNIVQINTSGAERMRISSAGNVGIGTTSPTSKLQVTGGDVEIETVTSGIIMKAAGTATRYRITLNAGGTALVFTAI